MTPSTLVYNMEHGSISDPERTIQAQDIAWIKHPVFAGVFLKHVIQGDMTGQQLSCHIVKIDPGCTLDNHTHAAQWELHEVIAGSGICTLDGNTLPYAAGQMTVIPSGTPHAVTAGDEGLVLLAKFFPALC